MTFPEQKVSGQKTANARWWPFVALLALSILALIFIWEFWESPIRQSKVLATMYVLGLALILALVWLFAFSRLRWRTRVLSGAAIVLTLALFAALFRVSGVSGDVLPIIEWRWAQQAPALSHAENAGAVAQENGERAWLSSHDYPQFLGPQRNGKIPGPRLVRDWSKQPPRQMWRQAIGAGWSAFAVRGSSAITQEQRSGQELVVSYELHTGKVKWSHSDEAHYHEVVAGEGPRATPTIAGDRVYTLGATGILNCLDFATGKQMWQKNIITDNEAKPNSWGVSCSPLVFDSLVVISAGGSNGRSLVAYHSDTGAKIWSGGDDRAGYSSPLLATLAETPQILIFNQASVAGHDPHTGKLLWQHPWPNEQPNVAQPLPLPHDRILVTSGYGIGCKLFEIKKNGAGEFSVHVLWETPRLKAKFTNVIFYEGYVYGLDDGVLVCLDLANGERKWKAGRYGHGQIMLIDDVLLIQEESGGLALVAPNPERHTELTRFAALDDKTWNNPALAGAYLLVRNHREAACYELPMEQTQSR